MVGPEGGVLAVDRDLDAVEAARALMSRRSNDHVSVTVAEAHDTGIAPESVDVVMIRHGLGHNRPLEEAIVAHAPCLSTFRRQATRPRACRTCRRRSSSRSWRSTRTWAARPAPSRSSARRMCSVPM